jgi:hypothetical protein
MTIRGYYLEEIIDTRIRDVTAVGRCPDPECSGPAGHYPPHYSISDGLLCSTWGYYGDDHD